MTIALWQRKTQKYKHRDDHLAFDAINPARRWLNRARNRPYAPRTSENDAALRQIRRAATQMYANAAAFPAACRFADCEICCENSDAQSTP